MDLKVIRGADQAKRELTRVDPLALDSIPPEAMERTVEIFGEPLSPKESVERILEDVRCQGDGALRRYARLLDGYAPSGEEADWAIEISDEQVSRAYEKAPKDLIGALELAGGRVEEFHRATLRRSWVDLGSGLGELVLPIERVGIYCPGGTASYPSTVLMTAIPAKVAGVKEVVLTTPAKGDGFPDPAVLAATKIAGVDRVFRVGGAQAIAAMAFGTETVPKVDKICGPGNIYVTMAKKLVYGHVDIDGLYGPTETVIVADGTASPAVCAADLLAQAEHDPMSSAILITTSLSLVGEVEGELERQLASLERGELAGVSLERQGKLVLVDSVDEAVELANYIAPEHLCLMVAEPWSWIGNIKHAGGVFLGPFSPEVMGDYVAGPSHVMPTGGTARYSSALSVHHFLRTMPVVGLKEDAYGKLAEAAAIIARAEGLTGHARAVEARLPQLNGKDSKGHQDGTVP